MKTAFQPSVKVRFNIPDGALAEIVRYEREGFYVVRVLPIQAGKPDGECSIAHEDDLELT